MEYPRLEKLGVHIIGGAVRCIDLDIQLISTHGEDYQKRFNKMFGIQTGVIVDGEPALFAWDCEAVLKRMDTGRKTGSQRHWD